MSSRIAPAPSSTSRPISANDSSPASASTRPGEPIQPTGLAGLDEELAKKLELGTGVSLQILSGLQQRRASLTGELAELQRELAMWRKLHGGFDSLRRLGAGFAQWVKNLTAGDPVFEGVASMITDAEALEKAPQRERIAELERTVAEVDAAVTSVSAGEPLPEQNSDYVLQELKTLQRTGALPSAPQLLESRVVAMKARTGAAADDAYVGAADAYLALPDLSHDDKGQPAPIAQANALILAGVVPALGDRLLLRARDLEEALEAFSALREDDKLDPRARAVLDKLPEPVLRGEVERLSDWEAAPEHARWLSLGGELQQQRQKVHPRKGFLRELGEGVLKVLDSPETLAMVAVAGGVCGLGRRLLA
ncbi:MAG: hypothetical protein ACT4TC_00030, partial [Myxococcaceae bacterium]